MHKTTYIDEGLTMDYLLPAFFVFLFACMMFVVHIFLGILTLSVAAAMISLRTGIEIDIANKRIRRRKSLFKKQWGDWIDISGYNHIHLAYERVVSRETGSPMVGMIMGRSNKAVTVRWYKIHFLSDGVETLEFYDFRDYVKAQKMLAICANGLKISHFDEMQEIRELAMERRKIRGRR